MANTPKYILKWNELPKSEGEIEGCQKAGFYNKVTAAFNFIKPCLESEYCTQCLKSKFEPHYLVKILQYAIKKVLSILIDFLTGFIFWGIKIWYFVSLLLYNLYKGKTAKKDDEK